MFHPEGPSLRELIRQALSSTKEGYDQLAPKFDHTPFATSPEVVDAVMTALLKENGGKKFDATMDLCTGTGAGVAGLIGITDGVIYGVDWSEPMIEEARKKFPQRVNGASGRPYLYFYCRDIFNFHLPPMFDLITCFGALGHIEKHQRRDFINQTHATLKMSGGMFAFTTAERPKWYDVRAWPYFAFDAIMRVRNYFIKPEFVMYYLNGFLLPEVLELFPAEKWASVKVVPLEIKGNRTGIRLVIAKKK